MSAVWGVHRQGSRVASGPRPRALELAVWIQSQLVSSATLRTCFHFAEAQLHSGQNEGICLIWLVRQSMKGAAAAVRGSVCYSRDRFVTRSFAGGSRTRP